VRDREPLRLASEEVFGYIGKWGMSMTVDTGAQVSIVPIECVEPDQLLGTKQKVLSFQGMMVEGERCNVEFSVGGKVFQREAVGVQGESIKWTPCLRVPLKPREDMEYFLRIAEERDETNQQLYQPLRIQDGRLTSGYLVSEGAVVEQTPRKDMPRIAVVEKEDDSLEDEIKGLMGIEVDEGERSSAMCDEASGDHGYMEEALREEASVSDKESELILEGIKGNRTMLVEGTKSDETLKIARGLGMLNKEGYSFKDGILLRSRMNKQGEVREQICLPQGLRQECLQLAHTKFGHQGRNKMQALIVPYFHWPTLSRDCQLFIKKCPICQKADKSKPPRSPMQLREVVTVPCERVAIDLVGPFPTAKGGFQYLLTAIDMATRWPEAVPLRSITAKSIIQQLTTMFAHSGFPKAIVSDNGQQFVGKEFSGHPHTIHREMGLWSGCTAP